MVEIKFSHDNENTSRYGFNELFDLSEIQTLQDAFSMATGVASIITEPDGTPITKPSGFCYLCNEIIRKSEKGGKNCQISDSIIGRPKQDGVTVQRCLSGGLIDAAASIMVNGKHIANWLAGQVLDEDCTEEELLKYADTIGVDRERYKEALKEVNCMSKQQFEKVCNFLYLNAQLLSKYAKKNIDLTYEISEKVIKEKEIIEARKIAEEANAAKSVFLANMSHEIRTPMNGILGMTDLAMMTALDSEQREYLQTIKLSTMSLLKVLNDILDYSKIEAERMSIENKPFEFRKPISEVIDLFEATAKQKGIDLKVQVEEKIPRILVGDYVRLKQVLSNIIGNAIKFTSQGVVRVEVCFLELMGEKVKLSFKISDTGIGISEDNIKNLFQRFYQVDSSNTRKYGGSGLGLVISKNFIELMNGQIAVSSKEGVGSEFLFSLELGLPVTDPQKSSEDVKESVIIHPHYKDKKVLLVEDESISRKVATIFLERKGITVISAENGKEAISSFEQGTYDLILMDATMPIMDGYTATSVIRVIEKKHTPIIAMTAHAHRGAIQQCLDAGMDDYISKPIDLEEFYQKIEKWLK